MAGPRLVVVGPPGAGKTSVGQRVADRLGLPFRDTDADIEASAGKPISDVFIDDGEEAFRAMERAAVIDALARHDGVLAVGGGAVLDENTRADLADRTVAFLSVRLADAAKRVGLARDRPVLTLNPRAQLRVLLEARRPFYEQVATFEVNTDGRDVDAVTDDVMAALR